MKKYENSDLHPISDDFLINLMKKINTNISNKHKASIRKKLKLKLKLKKWIINIKYKFVYYRLN